MKLSAPGFWVRLDNTANSFKGMLGVFVLGLLGCVAFGLGSAAVGVLGSGGLGLVSSLG